MWLLWFNNKRKIYFNFKFDFEYSEVSDKPSFATELLVRYITDLSIFLILIKIFTNFDINYKYSNLPFANLSGVWSLFCTFLNSDLAQEALLCFDFSILLIFAFSSKWFLRFSWYSSLLNWPSLSFSKSVSLIFEYFFILSKIGSWPFRFSGIKQWIKFAAFSSPESWIEYTFLHGSNSLFFPLHFFNLSYFSRSSWSDTFSLRWNLFV